MPIVGDEFVVPEPWWDLRGADSAEAEQRAVIETEVGRQIQAGHPLHGRKFSVVARSQATDDVLIALDDETWAVVHLTWQANEVPPWPATTIFSSQTTALDWLLAQ
jgi:hypothetical protein